MPRPALHSTDAILDAARGLILDGGARAATVDRIVAASGAPKGSIYHRFATVDDLLGAMWLRSVRRSQERFRAALEHPDAVEAAVAAALSIHDFARAEPQDARLLASVRREDLLGGVTDPELERALRDVNAGLGTTLRRLARRLYGRASPTAVERATFAVLDLPLGSLRRRLAAGRPLPSTVRTQLEAAVRAALAPTATRADGAGPQQT